MAVSTYLRNGINQLINNVWKNLSLKGFLNQIRLEVYYVTNK